MLPTYVSTGSRWRGWLGRCATVRVIAGSITDGVTVTLGICSGSGRGEYQEFCEPIAREDVAASTYRSPVGVHGLFRGWLCLCFYPCKSHTYLWGPVKRSKAVPMTGLGGPIGLWDIRDPALSGQSAHRWR
jgi:hypothetical protein